jgi:hypothetical protein
MAIYCILWSFGYIFPVVVCCTKKNLATLMLLSTRKKAFHGFKSDETRERLSFALSPTLLINWLNLLQVY